jgi:hypothetical protein
MKLHKSNSDNAFNALSIIFQGCGFGSGLDQDSIGLD